MNAEELIRILKQGEGPNVEFKQDFPKQVDEIAKEMSAFANSGGGVILMGVADDGSLPGILEPDKVMNRLAGLAPMPLDSRAAVTPLPLAPPPTTESS